jgi:hypothetical protein
LPLANRIGCAQCGFLRLENQLLAIFEATPLGWRR